MKNFKKLDETINWKAGYMETCTSGLGEGIKKPIMVT